MGKLVKKSEIIALVALFILIILVILIVSQINLERYLEASIIDADEIPGDWKERTGSRDVNVVSKTYFLGEYEEYSPAKIEFTLLQYENNSASHAVFLDRYEYLSFMNPEMLGIGDKCFKITDSWDTREFREMYCRVGNVVIRYFIDYANEYPLSDEWIMDLLELQISKLQR
jgi:hypothetical protein